MKITLICILSFWLFSSIGIADDGNTPIVIPSWPSSPGGTNKPHSSTLPLATGYYDYETNELTLTFLQDEGLCTISVTNINGEFVSADFDSALGTVSLPLSGTPGLYLITAESTSGLLASTTFLIV